MKYTNITESVLFNTLNFFLNDNKQRLDQAKSIDWTKMEQNDMIIWANRVVEYKAIITKPKHGEIFHWLGMTFSYLFWNEDERTFVLPYYGIDKDGSVPPCFRVGNGRNEFKPTRWAYEMVNNSFIFVSNELLDEIKEKVSERCDSTKKECQVKINGFPYQVTIEHDEEIRCDFVCVSNREIGQYF